jgi:Rrf2 family protein
MLSQKARYALQAPIVLARHQGDRPMQIADIARKSRAPRKFVEQLLLELKKQGIVRSQRSRLGGYRIGRSPEDITFADVIQVVGGPPALAPWVSVTAQQKCDDCVDVTSCEIRKVLFALRDATVEALESCNLARAASLARTAG